MATINPSDTALVRGVRTTIQTFIGAFVGLIAVVWAVPGVPEAVIGFVQSNLLSLVVAVGIPTGLTSFLWNLARKDVKNF